MRRRTTTFTCLVLAFSTCATHPSRSQAQSILHPAGLNLGDEYRLAFVTRSKRNALSSSISDYNAFVTSEALAQNSIVNGLQTEWRAIASTATVDATENTATDPTPPGETGVPIYLVDGLTRVADHYDNLWDSNSDWLVNPLNLTQYGMVPIGRNLVWTGTDFSGVAAGVAGGISGPLGTSSRPSFGLLGGINGRWINNGGFVVSASVDRSLYAISSVLVAVPEPSSGILLTSFGMIALVNRRRIRI